MKGTSGVRRLRAVRFDVFFAALELWLQAALAAFVCAQIRRRYSVIWNHGLQIAVECLHECCHVVLPCAQRNAGLRREVAKRIVMAASMLHGLRFGR